MKCEVEYEDETKLSFAKRQKKKKKKSFRNRRRHFDNFFVESYINAMQKSLRDGHMYV